MIDEHTHKIAVFLEQTVDKNGPKLTGNVITAAIPRPELAEANADVDRAQSVADLAKRTRLMLVSDGHFQKLTSECFSCDLCKVCAGDHRRYYEDSWPVGGQKCFAKLTKKGRYLRDEPCRLCEDHDAAYRKLQGDRSRTLTEENTAKNLLRHARQRRQQLFLQYSVDGAVIKDY